MLKCRDGLSQIHIIRVTSGQNISEEVQLEVSMDEQKKWTEVLGLKLGNTNISTTHKSTPCFARLCGKAVHACVGQHELSIKISSFRQLLLSLKNSGKWFNKDLLSLYDKAVERSFVSTIRAGINRNREKQIGQC